MRQFIGSCVENPFGDIGVLTNVVENHAKPISMRTFLKECPVADHLKRDMRQFPGDYEFYRSKMWLDNPCYILFFRHSAIEYFYN